MVRLIESTVEKGYDLRFMGGTIKGYIEISLSCYSEKLENQSAHIRAQLKTSEFFEHRIEAEVERMSIRLDCLMQRGQ